MFGIVEHWALANLWLSLRPKTQDHFQHYLRLPLRSPGGT